MLDLTNLDDYQQRGIDELYRRDVCFGIAGMGSGKTIMGLTAAQELTRDGVIDRWLVLGTKRIAQTVWVNEQTVWSHLKDFSVDTVVGKPPAKRWHTDADMICVNFELLPGLPPQMFEGARWGCIIDETTKLKTHGGRRAKAWQALRGSFDIVWGLTGTPRPNRYLELFGQVMAVAGPMLWGKSFTRWRNRFFYPTDYFGYTWELKPHAKARITHDLNTIGFRIDEDELPPRNSARDIDIVVQPSRKALDLYNAFAADGLVEVDGHTVVAESTAIEVAKQQQLAQGFLYRFDDEDARHTIPIDTVKIDALAELVDSMQGQPLLVVYQYQEDLRRILERWPETPYLGAGVSDKDAERAIARWNGGTLPMLAIHPASSGHGLNIQHGGRHLCWYGLPFSNELYRQTIKRLDRRGQAHQVINYRIMAEGTHDRRIVYDVLSGREMTQQAFVASLRAV